MKNHKARFIWNNTFQTLGCSISGEGNKAFTTIYSALSLQKSEFSKDLVNYKTSNHYKTSVYSISYLSTHPSITNVTQLLLQMGNKRDDKMSAYPHTHIHKTQTTTNLSPRPILSSCHALPAAKLWCWVRFLRKECERWTREDAGRRKSIIYLSSLISQSFRSWQNSGCLCLSKTV